MKMINLTPHDIHLNDGRVFERSGSIARVSQSYTEIVDDVCHQTFGDVENLPEKTEGITYIVSIVVLNACPDRDDIVVPATAHPETIRNDKGQIVSVPCFVR